MSTGSIAGRVLDATGAPVAGASVMFTNSPGPQNDIAAVTGASGSFKFSRLVPGAYKILVQGAAHGPGELDAEVAPGETVNVELRLP